MDVITHDVGNAAIYSTTHAIDVHAASKVAVLEATELELTPPYRFYPYVLRA